MISGLESISESESMPFTKMPRGVRDVARYMLHRSALTLGRDAVKSDVALSASSNGRKRERERARDFGVGIYLHA